MNIRILDIEFSYNGTPALSAVTGEISKGGFLALVGPNGSGKSTLIKCINGILKVRKGTVLIDEQPLQSIRPADLAHHLGYVPQNEPRNIPLKVFDTVLLGRKPYINWKPSERDIEITAQIIKSLNLENLSMKDVNKLSGGQQQTVFIARALAQEPDVLLLDEPTANLDIRHQVEVMELLKRLSEKGLTVIIAIHDINMALRYATEMMMLKDGHIFANGGKEIVNKANIEALYGIKVNVLHYSGNVFIVPDGLQEEKVGSRN
jgi:iron complex transport system ATP-binding protein